MAKTKKGQTYEEAFGVERAKKEKEKISKQQKKVWANPKRHKQASDTYKGKRNSHWKHEIGDIWQKGIYMRIKLGESEIMALHRYLMMQKIGRKLLRRELVHHVDGDTLNNDLSNLVIVSQGGHNIIHFAGKESTFKGRHHTEETKKILSEIAKGRVILPETRKKISNTLKGRPSPNKGNTMSEEARKRISIANKGENNSFYGKKHTEETRKKMSISQRNRRLNKK